MDALHLTDTHLFADDGETLHGIDTAASLAAIVAEIRAAGRAPDAVIVSGDIAHDDSRGAYRRLLDTLAEFAAPIVCLPGNHDDAQKMHAELDAETFVLSPLEVGGCRIVPADSQVAGHVHGEFGAERLAAIDATLDAEPGLPTLLFCHHPPVACGSAWLDGSALRDGPALLRRVAAHRQVKALLCGHIHQPMDVERGGVRVLATPATCRQFAIRSHDFALSDEAPGWRWVTLDESGMTTEVGRLSDRAWLPILEGALSRA